jgi:hypothetical protein
VTPTVAGGADASYTGLEEATRAFTRQSGTLTATLEDAAWIRLEGDSARAEERHKAYFQYGYTTFQVVLRSKEFTQGTSEEFLLEDSLGARHTGRPLRYEGAMKLEDNEWWTNRFTVSFPHVISGDVRWIRLSRVKDASTVEWTFPAPGGAPAPAPASPR